MSTGIASGAYAGAGAAVSLAASVWSGVGGRFILADDQPKRRSLVCSLYRGVGESALLCLFEACLVRAGGAGSAMGLELVAGLGHCGPGWLSMAVRRGEEGVKGFWTVELAAVDVPHLDCVVALICGSFAVYHSFGERFGIHGPVCNLPGPALVGG